MVILIGQDGVQRPPIRFPTTGSLLSFLNCLENGLHPHGELDPPLFNPRSKGLGLPRLKKTSAKDNLLLNALSKGENTNQDFVFRLVSGTKSEDLGMCKTVFERPIIKLESPLFHNVISCFYLKFCSTSSCQRQKYSLISF